MTIPTLSGWSEEEFEALAERAQELIEIAGQGRDMQEALHHLAFLAAKFEKEARDKNEQ